MADEKVRIKPRQDSAANWTSNNPILASGEHGYETDNLASGTRDEESVKYKIGDGVTHWNDLPYELTGTTMAITLADLSARVATTSNLTATYSNGTSGVGATLTATTNVVLPSIDTIDAEVGDEILVWKQTDKIENGVYVVTSLGVDTVSPWILTRTADGDTSAEIDEQIVFVIKGDVHGNKYFTQQTSSPVIGTDKIIFKKGLGKSDPLIPANEIAFGNQDGDGLSSSPDFQYVKNDKVLSLFGSYTWGLYADVMNKLINLGDYGGGQYLNALIINNTSGKASLANYGSIYSINAGFFIDPAGHIRAGAEDDSKPHVDFEAFAASRTIMKCVNALGTFYIAFLDSSPETVLTAPQGSLCVTNESGTGKLYKKATGAGNTGWVEILSAGAAILKAGDSGVTKHTFLSGEGIDSDSGGAAILNIGVLNNKVLNIGTGSANTNINIGTSGTNTIVIGNSSSTVTIVGTVINENVTNLNVTDKLITLNDGGAASTGSGVGFEIEEDSVITGYIKTTGGRDGFLLRAPANSADSSFIFTSTSARSFTFPNVSGTVITTGDTDTVSVAMIADAELKALAGLTSASNKLPYFTGSGTAGLLNIGNGDIATYSGTITWNSSEPKSLTTAQFAWSRFNNTVTLMISAIYAIPGTTNTQVTFEWPSGVPSPAVFANAGDAASEFMYPITGGRLEANMTANPTAVRGGIRRNAANTAFEIFLVFGSTSAAHVQFTAIFRTA